MYLRLILACMLVLPAVAGIGIAQDYLEDGELILEPGMSATHTVELQNVENQEIRINLSVQGDYTTIDGESYKIIEIPADQVRTRVQLDIDVPEDAEIGSRHAVTFSARQLSSEDGTVSVGVRLRNDFTIVIQEDAPAAQQQEAAAAEPSNWPYIALAALVIIVLVVFVFTRSSKIASRFSRNSELVDVLEHMSDQEFNDFKSNGVLAAWIAGEVKDPSLRDKLQSASTRQEAINILRNGK